MDQRDKRVKIRQEEMEGFLDQKLGLAHEETVSSYADKYQKLGWDLLAVNLREGTALEPDSGGNPLTWVNRPWETGFSARKINLGVRTGKRSRLMVLEVDPGWGEASLDQCGQWRAQCIAVLGGGRERHFYAWDPSALFDGLSWETTPEFRWYAEGQVVLVPPSVDLKMVSTWQWLCPPWEKSPQPPGRSLVDFLQQHLSQQPQPRPAVSMSWQEVYCLVSPFEPLLQALSASYPSMLQYYQGILEAAAMAGLKAPEALLSILWHAPLGNARQYPAIWGCLQETVAQLQDKSETATAPGPIPWELFLDDALALSRETAAAGSGQPGGKPGPPGFLRRCRAKPSQPGAAIRSPFSCSRIRGDLRKS
jgi:hypothetical protein